MARDEERYFLLYQWGLGARGGSVAGCVRVNEGSCCDDPPASCALSEHEWERVEAALLELKIVFPKTYEVVEARFVNGLYHEELFLRFSIKYPQLKAHLDDARMWVLSRYYQKNKAA
jgi:hypothetical protein